MFSRDSDHKMAPNRALDTASLAQVPRSAYIFAQTTHQNDSRNGDMQRVL